jgi:hypothetical protein
MRSQFNNLPGDIPSNEQCIAYTNLQQYTRMHLRRVSDQRRSTFQDSVGNANVRTKNECFEQKKKLTDRSVEGFADRGNVWTQREMKVGKGGHYRRKNFLIGTFYFQLRVVNRGAQDRLDDRE